MSAAPKQWTLKVISPATGPLEVLRDGQPAICVLAKQMCTVTNTLISEPGFSVSVAG